MKRLLLVLAACGSNDPAPHALGMNDVSILMPLPSDATKPVLMGLFDVETNPLVDPVWFEAMVFTRRDLGSKENDYFNAASFHVVAARVDLCDRVAAAPCPDNVDGMLRLVAQPIVARAGTVVGLDVGVHLFYPIPQADLASVIDQLRDLAAIQNTPDGPLGVSLAAAQGNAEYLTKLRALIALYANAANLIRFTANGQKAQSVGNAWLFRQLDRSADGINYDMALIPNADAYEQDALLQGGDISYVSDEVTDVPAGFAAEIDGLAFGALSPSDKAGSVDAIYAMQNPQLHDAFDTQCLGCHVGSYIGPYRASEAGIDPSALPSAFHSAHDLSFTPSSATTIRGFGYLDSNVVISQAVANATANVLDEISARSAF